jgi:hypothetical protein
VRQVKAADRNKAQIKNYEERFVINERGQLVSRADTERRQEWEQKRQEGSANPPAPGPTPEQRATKGRSAVEEALNQGQSREARLDPSFVGPTLSASEEAIRDTRSKAASNEAARVQGEREARPMAAIVSQLQKTPGMLEDGANEIASSFLNENKDNDLDTKVDEQGREYDLVRRDLGGGQFVESKIYRSAADANQSVGIAKTEDGTLKPVGEVTSALAQQNAADAAPSIAETYANASRQQNRGVGGDRNPSTDIIAGLTATADPNIIANTAVNKKSKEELEREKQIKALTQGSFPSNTRRATAV